MDTLDDFTLVQQVTAFHDKRSFDRLVVKYQSPIRRFFLSQTLGDKELSNDFAQDTFVKAYLHLSQFKGESAFSTWLFRIAYNVFYDATRRKKETSDIDTPTVMNRQSQSSDEPLRIDLYAALDLLSETERMCISLQLMEGESIDTIVEITGMANGTVKSHLFRGKQKMAAYLKQNGYGGK